MADIDVHPWVWAVTIGAVIVLLAIDLIIIGRRPHEPSTRESTSWVVFYVLLAIVFGAGLWYFTGFAAASEFYTGWVTEYSLSIDNLFVFIIIMSSFKVPRKYQQKVLMVGIITALILRGLFIAVGAALVNRFVWVFFIFGVFLIYTAIHMLRSDDDEDEYKENPIIRWSRRVIPVTQDYGDGKIATTVNGTRMVTPMLIVMIAIGTTDLMFAVDSIPAIFGLTREAYIVFTANVFALMGLRQLYFLLGGLLNRLVYLSYGLAGVLGFIGVKLILHALNHNELSFINNGQNLKSVPDIPTWVSLIVIVSILAIATVASLLKKPAPSAEQATSSIENDHGDKSASRSEPNDKNPDRHEPHNSDMEPPVEEHLNRHDKSHERRNSE